MLPTNLVDFLFGEVISILLQRHAKIYKVQLIEKKKPYTLFEYKYVDDIHFENIFKIYHHS